MKLVVVLSVIACSYAAKLDRTYLPPPGAKSSGGSSGDLSTPLGSPSSPSSGSPRPGGQSSFGGSLSLGNPNNQEPSAPQFGQAPNQQFRGQRPSGPDFSANNGPAQNYGSPQGPNGPSQNYGGPQGPNAPSAFGGSQNQFGGQGQDAASPSFGGTQEAQDNGPQEFNVPQTYNAPSQAFAPSQGSNAFPQTYQQPQRAQAESDRSADILKYINDNDGETFNYEFETSNGIYAQENGVATNGVQAQGAFSYTGDDGETYSITYTADENGYRPMGDHLPTPPPIPEAILRSIEINAQAAAAGTQEGAYQEDYDSGAPQEFGNQPDYPSSQPSGQQQYNAPQQQYNAPSQQNNGPTQQYNAPTQQFNRPALQFNAPSGSTPGYNAPSSPAQGYNATSASAQQPNSPNTPFQGNNAPTAYNAPSGPASPSGPTQAAPQTYNQGNQNQYQPSRPTECSSQACSQSSSSRGQASGSAPTRPSGQGYNYNTPSNNQNNQPSNKGSQFQQGAAPQTQFNRPAIQQAPRRPSNLFAPSSPDQSSLNNERPSSTSFQAQPNNFNQGPQNNYSPSGSGLAPSSPTGFTPSVSSPASFKPSAPSQGRQPRPPTLKPTSQFSQQPQDESGYQYNAPKSPSSFGSPNQNTFGRPQTSYDAPQKAGTDYNRPNAQGPAPIAPQPFGNRPTGQGFESRPTQPSFKPNYQSPAQFSPNNQSAPSRPAGQPTGLAPNQPGFNQPNQRGESFEGPKQKPSFDDDEGYKY